MRGVRRKVRRAAALAAIALGIVYTIIVAPVNLAVRGLGGRPALLSPFHYGDKVHALCAFAFHEVRHLFVDHADPRALIVKSARKHGVPEDLALAIGFAESSYLPHRVSDCGAMGIMQLMPDTAGELGVFDPYDSEQNIDGGVRYLARLWRRYHGDRRRVAAAYHAGPGLVPRRGPLELPSDTQRYVRAVLRRR